MFTNFIFEFVFVFYKWSLMAQWSRGPKQGVVFHQPHSADSASLPLWDGFLDSGSSISDPPQYRTASAPTLTQLSLPSLHLEGNWTGTGKVSGRNTHISATWSMAEEWPFPLKLETAQQVGQVVGWLGEVLLIPSSYLVSLAGWLHALGLTSLL